MDKLWSFMAKLQTFGGTGFFQNLYWYSFSIILFCLSHSFVYLLYFCPNWNRS